MDTTLVPMRTYVNKTASTCWFHLRHLRDVLSPTNLQHLVSALVLSRLDYCNCILAGLPAVTLQPLQRVQNVAARIMRQIGRRAHITPVLCDLHWLPVRYRIIYKLCLMMFNAVHSRCPTYITDAVSAVASQFPRRRLRSASEGVYVIPVSVQHSVTGLFL